MSPAPDNGRRLRRVWPVVAGLVVFSGLMAVRSGFPAGWMRAVVAAVAFAALLLGAGAARASRK